MWSQKLRLSLLPGSELRHKPAFARSCQWALFVLLMLVAALILPAAKPAHAQQPAMKCNGFEYLCDRRYDQVSYPTNHNAHSIYGYIRVGWNQNKSLPDQFADGIRGMMLDVYPDGGGQLCHNRCADGYISLSDGLGEVNAFLGSHPQEVVTLIFESRVEPDFLADAFKSANLVNYVYTYNGSRWPTLRQMITSNRRLVVFVSNLEEPDLSIRYYDLDKNSGGYADAPWIHSQWRLGSETPFRYDVWLGEARDIGYDKPKYCQVDRGTETGLFVLNHFIQTPQETAAGYINQKSFSLHSARYCQTLRDRLPNFVTVDFHEKGNYGLFSTVNELNHTAIICPSDIVVDAEPGECGAHVSYPNLSADNSPDATYTIPSGTFFQVGTHVVTGRRHYGKSPAGQQYFQTCSFKVTVRDKQAPEMQCPADLNVFSDAGSTSATLNVVPPKATDNCSNVSVVGKRSDNLPLTASYPVGDTIITWTATDQAGNSKSCLQKITVRTQADVGVVQTLTLSSSPRVGGRLDYRVQVTNNGPSPALGVMLANGFIGSGGIITGIIGAACTISADAASSNCSLGRIEPGASVNLLLSVRPLVSGRLFTTSNVMVNALQTYDSNSVNNSFTTMSTITR